MDVRLDGLMKALRMLVREANTGNRLPVAWLAIDRFLPPSGDGTRKAAIESLRDAISAEDGPPQEAEFWGLVGDYVSHLEP